MVLKDLGINHAGVKKTPVKKLLVKDKDKTSVSISVWSYFIPKVEVGKIYSITNMRIEKYPAAKPHQISTTAASKITDITNDKKEEFKEVSLADGSIEGNVEVFHGIYKYDCCSRCRCKIDKSMIRCATCQVILHDSIETLKYELCLNLKNDEMVEITGFLPSLSGVITLPSPLPEPEEIEDLLNDALEKKHVDVEFTVNKNNEKNVHKITLFKD